MMNILLNCDMGEGVTDDSIIMPHIGQANVCCGAHAGNQDITRNTIAQAVQHGVSVGAHPSYPDRDNFGRTPMSMTARDLQQTLQEQVGVVISICGDYNTPMDYVKPHGALNHAMVKNRDVFKTICAFMADLQSNHTTTIALMVPTCNHQDQLATTAHTFGIKIIWEIFADRAYESDGTLRSRTHSDATYTTPERIIQQVQHILKHGTIMAHDGKTALDISMAESLCIHGDNPASIDALPTLKTLLETP